MSKQTDLINVTDAITVDGSNNVGIGTSSPYTTLDLSGGTKNQVAIFRSTDATATIGFADNTTPLTANLSYVTIGATGSSMVFNTNLNERMRIDSDGCVTMPYQPCFAAYRSSSYNTASGDHEVDIDVATINRGNNYSTTENRFTAPVAGAYKFDCHISVYHSSATSLETQDDSQYLTFKLNGAELGRNSGTQSTMLNSGYLSKSGVEHSVSFSVVLQLAASDYVEVEYGDIQSAVTISNANFNGHLIG